MVRKCRHICDGLSLEFKDEYTQLFSDKQLSYDEGSRCTTCGIWIKHPTNSKLDIIIECEPDAQYYDIEGMPREARLLYPIKKLVKSIRCKCCGSQARGKTHANIKRKNKLREKIFNTFPRKIKTERAPRGVSNKTVRKKELLELRQRIDCDEESVFDYGYVELYNIGENEK
jgi:hypothetical protein